MPGRHITILLVSRHKYVSVDPTGSVISGVYQYLWLIIKVRGSFQRAKEFVTAKHARDQTPAWDDTFAIDLYLALQACKIFLF